MWHDQSHVRRLSALGGNFEDLFFFFAAIPNLARAKLT